MTSIANEIYNQVMTDLNAETDDGLCKIASTFYGIDSSKMERVEIMEEIAAKEIEAFFK